MKAKYAKLVVKDAVGNILQLLPETKVDTIVNEDSEFPVSGSALTAWSAKFLHTEGNETVTGQKFFAQGPYQTASTLTGTSIDLTRGSFFTKTITSNTAFTIANAPADKVSEFTLLLENGGSKTVTWPSSVTWPGGAAPILPAAGYSVLHFTTPDGSNWYGSIDISPNASKEVKCVVEQPTASNTESLENESLILWKLNSEADLSLKTPVFTTGNQTITGVKTFAAGVFGGTKTLSSSETAFDCSVATSFTKTITGTTTLSFINVPADATCCVTVILKNGGNYTVKWPTGVKWTENVAPILTSNGTDVLTFITVTGGNIWYGTTTCIGVA